LEALCKKLREDTQRLEEEKDTLEGMVEFRDELLVEIARETGWDRMGEDDKDEEEEEDADDGGRRRRTPATRPPTATPEEVDDEGPVEMIPEREAPVPHEVVLADAEPEMPQLRLDHTVMRDYEENPLRMEDDFDDLGDGPNVGAENVQQTCPTVDRICPISADISGKIAGYVWSAQKLSCQL
jgi:hypothetical protein